MEPDCYFARRCIAYFPLRSRASSCGLRRELGWAEVGRPGLVGIDAVVH